MRTVDRELEQQTGLRRRVGGFLSRHRKAVAAVVVVVVGLAIFGFFWFRPDKLFVNTNVNEALPAVGSAPIGSAAPSAAPAAGPRVLSTGRFRNLEHETRGVARIVQLSDGSRYVRFENFRTSSGPDVIVALSSIPATEEDWGAYDDGGFLSLGALKGNVGNQNYVVPASVDLSKYRSIVVWCRRFTVGFGAAPIR
jgi:hypothetical protein